MTLIALILSVAVSLESTTKNYQFQPPSPGFMVWASIDAARIMGLPFIQNQSHLTPEDKHEDFVWLMSAVIGPEEKIPRRKKFIYELVGSNRVTNFLTY